MNLAVESGYITKISPLKKTGNGKSYVSFTLAVYKRPFYEGDADAVFLPIVAYGKLAERCVKDFAKSSRVLVKGWINTRSFDDAEGIKRWITEIIAETIESYTKPKGTARERELQILPEYGHQVELAGDSDELQRG